MKKQFILGAALLGSSSIFGSESVTMARQTVEQARAAKVANYENYCKEIRQVWLNVRGTIPVATRLAEAKALLFSLLQSQTAPSQALDAVTEDLEDLQHRKDSSRLNAKDVQEFDALVSELNNLVAANMGKLLLQQTRPSTVAKIDHKREIKADNCCTAFSILVALGLLGYMTGIPFHLHLL